MPERKEADEIERLCREVLAPLIRGDGGVLYLVTASAQQVHIHLSGSCSGCPGSQFTRERIIEPLIATAAPKASLNVTSGFSVPEGAKVIE